MSYEQIEVREVERELLERVTLSFGVLPRNYPPRLLEAGRAFLEARGYEVIGDEGAVQVLAQDVVANYLVRPKVQSDEPSESEEDFGEAYSPDPHPLEVQLGNLRSYARDDASNALEVASLLWHCYVTEEGEATRLCARWEMDATEAHAMGPLSGVAVRLDDGRVFLRVVASRVTPATEIKAFLLSRNPDGSTRCREVKGAERAELGA